MKITDEAKVIIMETLASNESDCLKVKLQKSCCGTSLYLSLTKLKEEDTPVFINEIPVLMDNQIQARAESVTLATKNGKLFVEDDAASSC